MDGLKEIKSNISTAVMTFFVIFFTYSSFILSFPNRLKINRTRSLIFYFFGINKKFKRFKEPIKFSPISNSFCGAGIFVINFLNGFNEFENSSETSRVFKSFFSVLNS